MSEPGKIALITGAGSGIGRVVAVRLQGAGYHVVLTGRRAEELQKTAAQAEVQSGGRVLVLPTDVTDEESVKAGIMLNRTLRSKGLARHIAPIASHQLQNS